MTDPRFTKLAKLLVTYSTRVKKGDRVLLDMMDVPDEMSVELMRAVRAAGGIPLIDLRHARVTREIQHDTNPAHAKLICDIDLARMKKMQVYIAIRGSSNISEGSDVPSTKAALFARVTRPVQNYRVNKTRWVVLRWPSPSMAQSAGMSTEAFENLYFDVCTMDYHKMAKAMVPLQKRMKRADRVQLGRRGDRRHFEVARGCGGRCGSARRRGNRIHGREIACARRGLGIRSRRYPPADRSRNPAARPNRN